MNFEVPYEQPQLNKNNQSVDKTVEKQSFVNNIKDQLFGIDKSTLMIILLIIMIIILLVPYIIGYFAYNKIRNINLLHFTKYGDIISKLSNVVKDVDLSQLKSLFEIFNTFRK